MDPLSDIVTTLRIHSRLYFRARLALPWAVDVPESPGTVRFHLCTRGQALVRTGSDAWAQFQAGELVLVSHGRAHLLASSPEVPPLPLEEVLAENPLTPDRQLTVGEDPDPAVLVCGHFEFEDDVPHSIIHELPPVLHLGPSAGTPGWSWLDGMVQAMEDETQRRRLGWQAVVDRVSEILFIQILRQRLEDPEAGPMYQALQDPQIGRALEGIHRMPERWKGLEDLAAHARMSRTAFAVRFRELLGIPPMTYLKQWRLRRARSALVTRRVPISTIAREAGYSSEAAFSRAFQSMYSMPPGAYRRERATAP